MDPDQSRFVIHSNITVTNSTEVTVLLENTELLVPLNFPAIRYLATIRVETRSKPLIQMTC